MKLMINFSVHYFADYFHDYSMNRFQRLAKNAPTNSIKPPNSLFTMITEGKAANPHI